MPDPKFAKPWHGVPRERVDWHPTVDEDACMCQFTPGQYLEVWTPGAPWLSRTYSVGSAPREDGRVELHLRRVDGGRFTGWAFEKMEVGDVLTVRGPLGHFVIRSPLDRPLLLVARGTGFAPIKAMIEQQLQLTPRRDLILFWGVTDTDDFYELDLLQRWAKDVPREHITVDAFGG